MFPRWEIKITFWDGFLSGISIRQRRRIITSKQNNKISRVKPIDFTLHFYIAFGSSMQQSYMVMSGCHKTISPE